MRILVLVVLAAAQVCAADPTSESDAVRAFQESVLADLRRPFPTDAELSRRLVDHRKDFEQLVAMAKADNELVRIAPDFTWTTSSFAWPRPDSQLGFTPQRWDEYRQLFRALGLEGGIVRPLDDGEAVYLLVQGKGLIVRGSVKGYAYSETPLEPHCDSLDNPEQSTPRPASSRSVGNGIFIYSNIEMLRQQSNQSMKPTALTRNKFSVIATTPCRGLSLSR